MRVEREHEASRFAERHELVSREERDRLVKLAQDFPAVARRLAGPALREQLRPWLRSASFDFTTRELVLEVRHVPAAVIPEVDQPSKTPCHLLSSSSRRL